MIPYVHHSIMTDEVIESLAIRSDGIYVDGTAGGGGHSFAIGTSLSERGTLICNDRDEDALSACRERLNALKCNVIYFHGDFASLPDKISDKIDGVFLDIGVSSYQLDSIDRGFSYSYDAPLDMRMDQSSELTARTVVNKFGEDCLAKIFFEYGEERYSRRIAASIVSLRKTVPIETTGQLVEVIKNSVPSSALREKQHPAKRVFQAIRICVNDELGQLERALDGFLPLLKDGGRFSVLTFHSLEDRIVKNKFAQFEHPCTCPPEFPVCVCGKKPLGKVLIKGQAPTETEIEKNPRARSTRLRTFERRE